LVFFYSDTVAAGTLNNNIQNGEAIFGGSALNRSYRWPQNDNFGGTAAAGSANALGAVVGTTAWGLENNAFIPEIDIKVDSVSITAMTKKLKAKWTPELQQDINAYHNLDAEVELTGILSETIKKFLRILLKMQPQELITGHVNQVNLLIELAVLMSMKAYSQILLELFLNGMRLFSKPLTTYLHRFIVKRYEVEQTSWFVAQKLQTS
jgi:hypothetical protein